MTGTVARRRKMGSEIAILLALTLILATGCDNAGSGGSGDGRYRLSVSIVGRGEVTLSPAGGLYEEGTVVTLSAEPEQGYTFYRFEDAVTSTSSTTEVTVGTEHMDVTAYMPVFMTDSKSIIVKSVEDPISHMNRVEFLVDLNQPADDLDPGDGYRVWVAPHEGEASLPEGETLGRVYTSSSVLDPDARDIWRGGWWVYGDGSTYQYVDGGAVDVWEVYTAYWDADGGDDGNGENQTGEYHEFTFPVSVD